jgi:F-box-like
MDKKVLNILADLRSVRNAVIPINKLPMEIIGNVFSFLPDFVPSPDTFEFRYDPPFYRWITTTFVCRRWRAVALSFPSLWTIIDTSRMDATRAFIERSRQSPIDIYLRRSKKWSSYEDFIDFLQNLSILLPRTRTLHIGVHCEYSLDTGMVEIALATALKTPAPLLERLALCKGCPVPLPRPLFGDRTPPLTHLTIDQTSHLPPSHFTHLTQFCFCEKIDTEKTMSCIADLLLGNPCLEELFFGNSQKDQYRGGPHMPVANIVSEADLQSIRLPCLRKLSFSRYTSDTVAEVLSLFSLPPTVYAQFLNVTCHPSLLSIEHMLPGNFVGAIGMDSISRLFIKRIDRYNMVVTGIGDDSAFHIEIGTTRKLAPQFVRLSLDYLTGVIEHDMRELRELWLDDINPDKLLVAASTTHLTKIVIRKHEGSSGPLFERFTDSSCIRLTPNLSVLDVTSEFRKGLLTMLKQFAEDREELRMPLHRMTLRFNMEFDRRSEADIVGVLKPYVKEVDCQFGQPFPRMDLPKICRVGTHSNWPAWNV